MFADLALFESWFLTELLISEIRPLLVIQNGGVVALSEKSYKTWFHILVELVQGQNHFLKQYRALTRRRLQQLSDLWIILSRNKGDKVAVLR